MVTEKSLTKLIKKANVIYKNSIICRLNVGLILQQKLNNDSIKKLRALHRKRFKMFEEMKKIRSKKVLKSYVPRIERIEFALQEAWGFPKNAKLHCWWNRAPKCRCPKMDNDDRFGTGVRVISSDCPLHHNIDLD